MNAENKKSLVLFYVFSFCLQVAIQVAGLYFDFNRIQLQLRQLNGLQMSAMHVYWLYWVVMNERERQTNEQTDKKTNSKSKTRKTHT